MYTVSIPEIHPGLISNTMDKMYFSLNISPEQYQSYYQGSAKFIAVQAQDGRTLKFPTSALQEFVSHSGVQGQFEIEFNDQHKLVKLSKLK